MINNSLVSVNFSRGLLLKSGFCGIELKLLLEVLGELGSQKFYGLKYALYLTSVCISVCSEMKKSFF